MGYKDWQTPPDWFAEQDAWHRFTLDAAASHENTLLPHYCTIDGTYWPDGALLGQDGLSYPWTGERVFCNPPYDNNIGLWVAKALSFEADFALLLLPPSVDTRWFRALNECRGRGHVTIEWYPGRLRFWRDGKVGPAPRAGNLIASFYR